MVQDEKNPGIYRLKYFPAKEGHYSVRVSAGTEELPEKGEQINKFYVSDQSKEDKILIPDEKFLAELAEKTGGRVLQQDELNDFASNVPQENFKVVEERSEPIWNRPWVFIIIILLLSGEWWIRRTRGMP